MLGILNFDIIVCFLGLLYCKCFEIEKIYVLKVNKGDFDVIMCIFDGFISDLKWWYNNIECMELLIRREFFLLEMFIDVFLLVGE